MSAFSRIPAALRNRKLADKVGTMLAVRVASTAVTKQLDITNPRTVMWLRVVFIAIQLAAIAVFVHVLSKIRAKNDTTVIKTKPPRVLAKAKALISRAVTGQETVDPKEHELITTTVVEYDVAQAKAAIKAIVRNVVLMGGIAVLLGWNKMLIAPVISRPVETIRHALFQLHILDAPAVGSLSREATPEQVAAAEKAAAEASNASLIDKVNGDGAHEEEVELVEVVDEKAPLEVVDEKAPIEDDLTAIVGQVISEKTTDTTTLRQRRAVEVL